MIPNLYPIVQAAGWRTTFADSNCNFRADGKRGKFRLMVQQNAGWDGTYLAFVSLVTSLSTRTNGYWSDVEEMIGESGPQPTPESAIEVATVKAREWMAARLGEL